MLDGTSGLNAGVVRLSIILKSQHQPRWGHNVVDDGVPSMSEHLRHGDKPLCINPMVRAANLILKGPYCLRG